VEYRHKPLVGVLTIIHGSERPETAVQEINLFFQPEELVDYKLVSDRWINKQ
jgi:nucleoside-diphosphate kinase